MADLGTGYESKLPTPNLRNGDIADMVAIVPSTAIPVMYHWNMVGGVPDDRAMAYTAMNMRLTYAMISMSATTMTDDKRRSQAIILGAMRTGLRVFWNVVPSDISPGELGRAFITYREPRASATPAVTEGVNINWGTNTTTAGTGAWNSWTDLSDLEQGVAEAFIMLSIGALPTCGWSIIRTGHHFLSQAGKGARSGYDAIKKQWFTKIPAGVATWVRQREEYWEDIAFHKACHPILMSLCVEIASKRDTKMKLQGVDFGSAAVRIPATAPQLEYAKMVLALLGKVSGVLSSMGAEVNVAKLMTEVTAVYENAETRVRATHIEAADTIAHSRDPQIAIAAGILLHITEAGAPSTIAASFGFKRLVQEYPAEVAMGATLSRSLAARQRQSITEGGTFSLSIVF